MSYVDFRESRYTLFSKRSGLRIRVLNRTFGGQAQYFWPLFEYKLKVAESDQVADFNPKTATIEDIEAALKSSSPRVRMRAIITKGALGIKANVIKPFGKGPRPLTASRRNHDCA